MNFPFLLRWFGLLLFTASVLSGFGCSTTRTTSETQHPRDVSASSDGVSDEAGEEGIDSGEEGEEEFFDPFAEEGEILEEYDPFESYNSAMFTFNYNFDKYFLKPIATGYDFITPNIVQRGLFNMIQNVRVVPRFLNNVFQGKFTGAGIEVGRFLVNSTVGIGGFFDPAKSLLDLETPLEDFGQTLGVYGVGPGPYLILPLFPTPLTVRDGVGFAADIFLDPFNYFVLPFARMTSIPQIVKDPDLITFVPYGIRVGEAINLRSLNLETFQGVEDATIDLYSAVRNGYLQQRKNAIQE